MYTYGCFALVPITEVKKQHQLPWESTHLSAGNGTCVLWKGSQVFLNAEVFPQSLSPQLMFLSYRFLKSLSLNFTYRISAKEKKAIFEKYTEELFVCKNQS